MKRIAITVSLLLVFAHLRAQMVNTFAGSAGQSGMIDATGTTARFNNPHGMTSDKAGNVYVTDRYNNRIRKITPSGVVTTLAGTGVTGSTDGPGSSATFNEPWGIAADTLGNVYVADTKNYKIRKIDFAGNVTTIAGTGVFGTTNGTANVSSFGFPSGIATTQDGSIQYVTDYNTHVIRKISGGMVSNFAGMVYMSGANNGAGLTATFNHPYGIAIDLSGNLYVGDEWNNVIRKITPVGFVSTLAGNGTAGSVNATMTTSSFNSPWGVTVDSLNSIFVMDGLNYTIRKINTVTNTVTTYAGTPGSLGSTDGYGAAARFNNAAGITYNRADHSLYVADCSNHTIRKIVFQSATTIALSIVGNSTVCATDSIHLSATPGNLTNYVIYSGGIPVGSSVNGTIVIPSLPPGSHTLSCTATDAIGATASSNNVTITVLPTFIPTITGSNAVCSGDSILLSAQISNSYLWSNGLTTQNIWVNTGGNFTVSEINSTGCKGISATHTVTLKTRPTATINSAGTQICPNDSMQLIASAGSSYSWSTGATTQSIAVHTGTYTVTVTAANNCTASSLPITITGIAVTPPTITPSGTITIVQGDSVQLTATGGSNWIWSNGQMGNSIYVKNAGTYTVTAQVGSGCTATSAGVQMNVINASTLLVAMGPTSFCEGYNVVLQSLYPTGNQWYFNGAIIPAANAQQYIATDSGYFSVQVTINGNTIRSDSILVSVKPTPPLISVADTSICAGASIDLSVKPHSGESYEWYDAVTQGNLVSSLPFYQTPKLSSSTTYFIETIGSNGCHSMGRAALNVFVLLTPAANFVTASQTQSGQYVVDFTNTSLNANTYLWIFGDTSVAGNSSTDLNVLHIYSTPGDYPVTLIATNANGCSDTLSRLVRASSNNDLFIPTTFTPNGDGKNDIFRVRGDHFTVEEMSIFDQWGTVVFHADASSPTWDGRANGDVVENGTYVYKIRILTDAQISRQLTGSITVIK